MDLELDNSNCISHLYDYLLELKKAYEEEAKAYESSASYEMAYLSLWIILEKMLKRVDFVARKRALYLHICEWKEYLEGKGKKRPSDIKSFILKEVEKIPDFGKVEHVIGCAPITKEIMNAQPKNGSTKWRDRRNNIAHNAESFKRLETYRDYRDKLMEGILEIEILLQGKPKY